MDPTDPTPNSHEIIDRILLLDQSGEPTDALFASLPPAMQKNVRRVLEERRSIGFHDSTPTISPPAHVGRFALLERAGGGAQGEVYRAFDPQLRREVALKILSIHGARPDALARLGREARVLSQLNSPAICPIHEVGSDDGAHFIVMPWLSGQSFESWLRERPAAPQREDLESRVMHVQRIAEAMQIAHEHGVVHRDLKPGNVQITDAGEAIVLDFGLASASEPEDAITQPGSVIGTPAYSSPEQLTAGSADRVDARTDIWSLGVILFEVLTAKRPFRAPTRAGLVHSIQYDPPPAEELRRIDRDLRIVLQTALAKAIDARYQSMTDFAADLDAWRNHRPIRARPPTLSERSRRWIQRNPLATTWMLAFALVAIAALGMFWESQSALADTRALHLLAEAQSVRELSPGRAMAMALHAGDRVPSALLDDAVARILERPVESHSLALPPDRSLRSLIMTQPGIVALAEDGWLGFRNSATRDWRPLATSLSFASVSFDAHGDQLFATTRDGEIWRIAIRDGAFSPPSLAAPRAVGSTPTAIASAGDRLLRAYDDGRVEVLSARDGRVRSAFRASDMARLAIAAESDSVVWTNGRGRSSARRTGNGDGTTLAKGHFGRVEQLAIRPRGDTVAAASLDNRVHVWYLDGRPRAHDSLRGHRSGVASVAWHPHLPLLASGGHDRSVMLWQPAAKRRLWHLIGHSATVVSVAFSPDGERLVSGDAAGTIKVWPMPSRTGAMAYEYGGRQSLRSAILDADGTRIAAVGNHGYLGIHRAKGAGMLVGVDANGMTSGRAATSAAFHPRRGELAIALRDGSVEITDSWKGQTIRRLPDLAPPADQVTLSYSPSGHRLLATTSDGHSVLMDSAAGEYAVIARGKGYAAQFSTGTVSRQAFVANRYAVVSTGDHDTLTLHCSDTGEPRTSTTLPGARITCVEAHPGTGRLACASTCGRAFLLQGSPRDFEERHVGRSILSIRWNRGGDRLVCAGADGSVTVLSIDDSDALRIHAHDAVVYDALFDDRGERVLSVSFDGSIALWNANSGALVRRRALDAPQVCASFSSAGDIVLSAGIDGTIRTWPARPAESVRTWFGIDFDESFLRYRPR